MSLIVIAAVSAALIAGAIWGLYGRLSQTTEGIVLAVAGGALIHAVVDELVGPAVNKAGLGATALAFLAGALIFTGVDRWLDRRVANSAGLGLLLAIMLDGIPENLALGVTLIDASPREAAALAGAIFLSNLPEAAGGAREMCGNGLSKPRVMALWIAAAVLLASAAVAGNLMLSGVPTSSLAPINAFAGGAVVASLAVEVFPKAFRSGHWAVGPAVALGLLLAVALGTLA